MPKLTRHVLRITCSDDSSEVKSVWKVFRYVSNKHCCIHAVRKPRVLHWVIGRLKPNKKTALFKTWREGCHMHSIHTHNELFCNNTPYLTSDKLWPKYIIFDIIIPLAPSWKYTKHSNQCPCNRLKGTFECLEHAPLSSLSS